MLVANPLAVVSPPVINASMEIADAGSGAGGSSAPNAGDASNAANPPAPESGAVAGGGSGNDAKPAKSSAAAGGTESGAAAGTAALGGLPLDPDPKSPKSPKSATGDGAVATGAGAGVTSICDGAGVFPPFRLMALYVSCMATLKWSRETKAEPFETPVRSCLMRSGSSFALLKNFTASSRATRPCLPPGSFE